MSIYKLRRVTLIALLTAGVYAAGYFNAEICKVFINDRSALGACFVIIALLTANIVYLHFKIMRRACEREHLVNENSDLRRAFRDDFKALKLAAEKNAENMKGIKRHIEKQYQETKPVVQ